jgi:hypothetical protein
VEISFASCQNAEFENAADPFADIACSISEKIIARKMLK